MYTNDPQSKFSLIHFLYFEFHDLLSDRFSSNIFCHSCFILNYVMIFNLLSKLA